MNEDTKDPRHVYQARAWVVAKEAEKAVFQEVEPPQKTAAGMLIRALRKADQK